MSVPDSLADLFRVGTHDPSAFRALALVRPLFFSEAVQGFARHSADVAVYRAVFVYSFVRVTRPSWYGGAGVKEEADVSFHEVES